MEVFRPEVDGRPVTPDEHDWIVEHYDHFTAMQVRHQSIRGLDLHLARLDRTNRALFGKPAGKELVRERIRHALGADIADASVRIYATEASVIVTVREPCEMPATPQSLRSIRYQRPLAHLKHRNGFGYDPDRQAAIREGYDDVLFTSDDGTISEGGITNVGCWDGSTVWWPDAPEAGRHHHATARQGVHRPRRTHPAGQSPSG